MVEARTENPYGTSLLHKPMGIVEAAVGSERNIALGTQHNLHFDAALNGALQCSCETRIEREVGINYLDAVACGIDGSEVELANGLWCGARLTVYDAYGHVVLSGEVGLEDGVARERHTSLKILFAINTLVGSPVPDAKEDVLEGIHLKTRKSAVHVVP